MHTEPRWSPEGSRLVFRRIEKLQSDIAILSAATQAVTRVTNDYVFDVNPTWAPDGRAVVFSSAPDGEASSAVPLLHGRPTRDGAPAAYVCRTFVCEAPTTDPAVLAGQVGARVEMLPGAGRR